MMIGGVRIIKDRKYGWGVIYPENDTFWSVSFGFFGAMISAIQYYFTGSRPR